MLPGHRHEVIDFRLLLPPFISALSLPAGVRELSHSAGRLRAVHRSPAS